MWPQWSNMLSGWQWAVLGLTPPAIIALYFLKLRRQPVVVPSTYLWRRTVEDLHVNAFWQRLRKNILLWLQLALVALVMLALLRPSWNASQLVGGRLILLVDNSASMSATDVRPSRLDAARQQALELIDQMQADDVAMVIVFSDQATVAASFTQNRQELRRAVRAIQPSDRSTSIAEALRAAAGLANAAIASADEGTAPAAAMSAKLLILSDGKFPDVGDFSLGNLEPSFLPIGQPESGNVGITALGVERNEGRRDERQAFVRVENFSAIAAKGDLTLHHEQKLLDAQAIELPPREGRGLVLDLPAGLSGSIELRLSLAEGDNALEVDDRAWLVLEEPRRASLLVVTPGNDPLRRALETPRAADLARVRFETPDFLNGDEYRRLLAERAPDLIVYDRCLPSELPPASTWFIGRVPPGDAWSSKPSVPAPQILDHDNSHPLMQAIELSDVLIAETTPLVPPKLHRVLVESTAGPLLAIAPREAHEDLVLGIELIGGEQVGTNWPLRLSFPVFVLNLIDYFGSGRQREASGSNFRPGEIVTLPIDEGRKIVAVTDPAGVKTELGGESARAWHFSGTDRAGLYRVESESGRREFAVNLLDAAESAISPRTSDSLEIGYAKVEGLAERVPSRNEGWKLLVLGALVLVGLEWYVYNTRLGQ